MRIRMVTVTFVAAAAAIIAAAGGGAKASPPRMRDPGCCVCQLESSGGHVYWSCPCGSVNGGLRCVIQGSTCYTEGTCTP